MLQRLALGQQWALVDDGAQKLQQRRAIALGRFDARNVQVAGDVDVLGDGEYHFIGFRLALDAGQSEGLSYALRVFAADKRQQLSQGAVVLAGLKRAVRHRVGLRHHVVLIYHHQRQWYAGEQRLKALRGAFCCGLAVAQHLVLRFQLGLVGTQLANQAVHGNAGGQGAVPRRVRVQRGWVGRP